ncbi:lytic transglycosylase domain-containing protein [Acinetobacter sp.]|uniref:lytic transglycosylase domain-containing protein n=2 Tax=Acinetobacter TaxID=469 RepID=UPI00388E937B
MKIDFTIWAMCTAVGTLCLSTLSFAGETLYQLKDHNGTTLLTNKHSKYSDLKVEKKTYYPESNIHQYRNYGSTEAAVAPSQSRNKNAFDGIIQQAAQTYGVSAGLIKAVMHTESGFNVHARSPVGAQGLMQLMPATARRFNVSNAYDPQQNIMAGAKYLAWLLKRFNGNTSLALAGYNAGEGNVQKYGGIPPFRETQDYVRRVHSRYQNLYAGGLGIASSNNASLSATSTNNVPAGATLIAQSNQSATVTTPTYSREVIRLADGSYTDRPVRGSYSTGHATASASITITD